MITLEYPHKTGHNCESASQRNLLNYFGADIEEEIIFGLDGSFGFTFFEGKKSTPDVIVGKNEIFPMNAAKLLGIKVLELKTFNSAKLLGTIKDYIDDNIPLLCRVDLGHLPYWKSAKEVFFGGYFVVIVGYDEQEKSVWLSDTEFEEIQKISLEDFIKAQASKDSHPINPNCQVFVYRSPKREFQLEKIGPLAIRNTVRNVLKPKLSNFGLPAINKLRNAISNWDEKKTGETSHEHFDGTIETSSSLVFQMKSFGKSVLEFGTGGAFFRSMYASFLESCFDCIKKPALNESALLMYKSADYWKKIANAMLQVNDHMTRTDLTDILISSDVDLIEILNIEKKAFELLKRI